MNSRYILLQLDDLITIALMTHFPNMIRPAGGDSPNITSGFPRKSRKDDPRFLFKVEVPDQGKESCLLIPVLDPVLVSMFDYKFGSYI